MHMPARWEGLFTHTAIGTTCIPPFPHTTPPLPLPPAHLPPTTTPAPALPPPHHHTTHAHTHTRTTPPTHSTTHHPAFTYTYHIPTPPRYPITHTPPPPPHCNITHGRLVGWQHSCQHCFATTCRYLPATILTRFYPHYRIHPHTCSAHARTPAATYRLPPPALPFPLHTCLPHLPARTLPTTPHYTHTYAPHHLTTTHTTFYLPTTTRACDDIVPLTGVRDVVLARLCGWWDGETSPPSLPFTHIAHTHLVVPGWPTHLAPHPTCATHLCRHTPLPHTPLPTPTHHTTHHIPHLPYYPSPPLPALATPHHIYTCPPPLPHLVAFATPQPATHAPFPPLLGLPNGTSLQTSSRNERLADAFTVHRCRRVTASGLLYLLLPTCFYTTTPPTYRCAVRALAPYDTRARIPHC